MPGQSNMNKCDLREFRLVRKKNIVTGKTQPLDCATDPYKEVGSGPPLLEPALNSSGFESSVLGRASRLFPHLPRTFPLSNRKIRLSK